MNSYEDIGLDSNLQPVNAPISQDRGFISATTFDINNERNVITNYQIRRIPWVDCTDSATITLDLSKGNRQRVTIADSRTLVVINGQIGNTFIVRIQQGGTGSNTITWFSTIAWAGGSAPTLTTTVNKADEVGFIITGNNTYDGFAIGINI